MLGLRQYALSVVTAAMICGIISSLVCQDTARRLLRLVSGLVMTLVVLGPAANADLPSLESLIPSSFPMGEDAVEAGKALAQDSIEAIIKSTCEAYILDKAACLGAAVDVSITLDSENIPVSAAIRGTLSPEVKEQLETILETDLGITKEHQSWMG